MNTHTHIDTSVSPFNYELKPNENAYRYGRYYHAVVLVDGRELMFNADQIIITDTGDFLAISKTKLNAEREYITREEPITLLSIASGFWTAHYSASVDTGLPVCIDSLSSPQK